MSTETLKPIEKKIVRILVDLDLAQIAGFEKAAKHSNVSIVPISTSQKICIEDACTCESCVQNLQQAIADMCLVVKLEAGKMGVSQIVSAEAKWVNDYDAASNPERNLGSIVLTFNFQKPETETTNTSEEPVTQVIDLEADFDEQLPTRTCNVEDGECESCS